jgi:hypothetical protein
MIGGVGLYSLFAMLYLFYYHANNAIDEDEIENNAQQDIAESSIKADKDAQDDAGDVNELGTTIIRKKKVRKLGTSMRRILVNQVSSSSYSTLMYFCVYSF